MIVAAGGHDEDTSWTEALVSKAADAAGMISFHYYTIPGDTWSSKGAATGFKEDQWVSTLSHTLRMEDFIARNSAIMDRYDPAKKIGFAVDEWGTWYDPEPGSPRQYLEQQNTLRDALVAALNLGIFMRHADRVRLANIAQMVNVLQAMILTHGRQMILTPTYYVFRMLRPFQGATELPVGIITPRYTFGTVSLPAISVSAARVSAAEAGASDTRIELLLANLDPHETVPVSIDVRGFAPTAVSGEILSASAMDAHNTFDHPDAVRPAAFTDADLHDGALTARLPAKSVLVLQLR